MICPTCQADNPEQARFCSSCGSRLLTSCPNCNAEQPSGARFCSQCGHSLSGELPLSDPPVRGETTHLDRFIPKELLRKLESAREVGQMAGERRVVTMLFCDVKGSTAAAARFDPEEWAEIINGAFARMIEPVYQYEGTVARLMGDGLLAFFGAPIAHEDDPQRAILAGLGVLEGIRDYRAELQRRWGIELDVRVGVNTGLVVVGAVGSDLRMEYSALGNAINLAARMEQTALPNTVQIADPTYRLVAPLFDVEVVDALEVKGVEEPVPAYRVLGRRLVPGSLRGIAGLASPMVGREAELAALAGALDEVSRGEGHIVSITGEAGLGKSRLVAEALRGAAQGRPLRWLEGKSQSYETSVPYAPFASVLAQSAGLLDSMTPAERYAELQSQVERLIPGRGEELATLLAQPLDLPVPLESADRIRFLEPPALRSMVFEAVATWIEALAIERPTVLLLDDIHWIDPTSLALLERLLPLTERAPLLLLLAFRPRSGDPSWRFHESASKAFAHRYRRIDLRPLDENHARELVRNLLEIEELPESVRQLILAKSEGNPFFLEEVIRSLLDAGLVVRHGESWRATSEIINLRVPGTLTGVITARLDRLSETDKQVIQAAAVIGREFSSDTLADLLGMPRVPAESLSTLQRRELVRPSSPDNYIFKHVLTQEAAYESLLLSRRRQLHHRAADSLLKREPDRAAEIARHYLEARQPAKALPHLVEAGKQDARAFAVQEAFEHFTRTLEYEELADVATARAAYEGAGELTSMSDPARALATYERMLASAEARSDVPMTISALNKLGNVSALMLGQFDQAEKYLARAEQLGRDVADPDGIAELSIVRCMMCTFQADFDGVIHYMDGVIDSSLKTGNEHHLSLGLSHTASSLLSLGRFEEAWATAHETLALARRIGDRAHEVEMLTYVVPFVEWYRGNLDSAIKSATEGLTIARRIGSITGMADGEWVIARILTNRGEYEEALAAGRRSLDAALPLEGFVPFYLVHPLSTLGTIYVSISKAFTDKIGEVHRYALRLLELPGGAIGGGTAWAELGWCAWALGDWAVAEEMFTKGLNYPSMMMLIEKPRHLAGLAMLMLERGNHNEARRLAQEALDFANDHAMKNFEPLVRWVLGRILAAEGDHDRALQHFELAARAARSMTMRPILLEIEASKARSLHALGREDDAGVATAEALRQIDAIAGLLSDGDLRPAFREAALNRLTPDGLITA